MVRAKLSPLGQFPDGVPSQDGCGLGVDDFRAIAARMLVVRFQQQPLLLGVSRLRPRAHQVPTSLEASPFERKCEAAARIAFMRIAFRNPAALIPHDHRAAAILAGRYHALESQVFQRVIFGVDRQPLLAGNKARTAGCRPTFQDSVEFKSEVEMQAARVVLLHHEAVALGICALGAWFGRD
jgi:hypothetical protein